MNWFLHLFSWTLDCAKDLRDRVVELISFPISFRIILHPEDLLKVMQKNNIHQDIEKIKMIIGADDNVIGQYHISGGKRGTVEIDVGEIVSKIGAQDPNPETIDRVITNTIAHELRHRWQEEKFGRFLILADRILIFFLVIALGFWFGIRAWFLLATKLISSGVVWKIVLAGLCIYAAYAMFMITLRIAKKLAYKYCWSEMDARRFANKAEHDADWQKIIDVQFALTIPFPVSERQSA